MAKQASAATTAMRAGVHEVSCELGTVRVHVARDISAQEVARAFGGLVAPAGREVTADAA